VCFPGSFALCEEVIPEPAAFLYLREEEPVLTCGRIQAIFEGLEHIGRSSFHAMLPYEIEAGKRARWSPAGDRRYIPIPKRRGIDAAL
jgi:hypothetical protein